MNGCVIIPTFNEQKKIHDLVVKVKEQGLKVIVIDDGSRDNTKTYAETAGAFVIAHEINRGKGASLRSGFDYSLKENFDFTIVMDGDGQHHPDDICRFIDKFKQANCDMIIGNRMDNPELMPYPRWLTNKFMSMIISSICKQYIPDTQCGFRLLKNSALRDIVISTSNYEVESEMLMEAAKKKFVIKSVPIRTIYEDEASQINPVVDTIRFFKFLLKDWIRGGWTIFKEFFNDVVVKHGSIIFLSSLLCNVFSLVFWLFMLRRLNHVEYGILNSMVSLLALLSLPSLILQTVLARYFAEFKALEHKEGVMALFRAFFKRIAIAGVLFALVVFILAGRIGSFFQLESNAYIYISIIGIFSATFLVLTISTLQGIHYFKRIALNSILHGFLKLLSGVVLVVMGLRSLGGFMGFVFAEFFAFIFSLFQLPPWIYKMNRMHYVEHKSSIRLTEIYGYFLPVSIALIAYNLFINIDVILVKHFFNESDAGMYSVAQTIGKILLYLSSSITLVFFPVSIQHTIQKKSTLPLLKKCLLFVGSLSSFVLMGALFFPRLMLLLITGKVLPECVPLVRFIIFPMSIFSIVYIFIFYNLSLGNYGFIRWIFFIALLQILLICLFHQSLLSVIAVLLFSALLALGAGLNSIRKPEHCS